MAESFVPQRCREDLDTYLIRVHQMVLKLQSGDCLMVLDGAASLPIYHWNGSADDISSRVELAKKQLLERNEKACSLPMIVFTPDLHDGWAPSVDRAAELAYRLDCKVIYSYGSVVVHVYPWHVGFTAALCSEVMLLAHKAGATMARA
ncbi:hypothetical protein KBF38_16005 [bacterium]|nr:hypothetical protein [bacterium]